MTMSFVDRAPIESVRRLPDGRLAAVVKFARSGTQTYLGSEVGRPDLSTVTVYRSEDEVFHEDAMASFAHKSITLGHPSEPVTADNWKRLSVGFTEGRVARNGAFLEIPMMVADASAISAIDSGTAKQLSAGYSCELQWGDGVAPDGTPYQAKQVGIKANHIAIVAEARGGPELRIGDTQKSSVFDERAKHMNQAKALSEARYMGMSFHDAKPDADKTSIDAELRETIARLAKNNNQTPEEYLAATPMAQIQRLASEAAVKVVEALSGKGIASELSDYRVKSLSDSKSFSAARYHGAPMIEAADSETPTQPSMGGHHGSDATATIRSLRYQ